MSASESWLHLCLYRRLRQPLNHGTPTLLGSTATSKRDMIQEKLRNHYAPKPSKIAAHHAFYHRNQAEGGSINNHTTALRQAAMHCEFQDLDGALMDRIICGVQDSRLQRRLLAKPDLTL
ncbi:Hypothetical predicted protein [Podarcis lilfordi]|uniref:Uncharacterized protein n=1 Tax=Podarcis lilfordi TaxID=74358 RepID=A0AA35NSD1_9SAUR|nr:Hypothetical predicted protein [Podarcis lilfordi]